MNLFSLLENTARRFPERGAIYQGNQELFSYAELRLRALSLATGLRRVLPAGSRIAVASENRPEIVELMFGIWAAGMVFVPLNYKLHVREMTQILADAGASVVFASPALAFELNGAIAPESCSLVTIGQHTYQEFFDDAPQGPSRIAPEALAWLFYTSGTTGRSKGAMLSHRNLMAMTVCHLADIEQFDENATQIHAAPMSHGSGLYIPAYISRGARQVIPASGGYDPAEFLDLCNVHPACGAFLAPTMVQWLRVEAEKSGVRPANLRCIVYGGGPMYVEEIRKSLDVFGPVFAQIYGQGEIPMTITGLRQSDLIDAGDDILGSVGFARTGVEVAVVDADGKTLPPGEVGEIVCRGDTAMSGYWNDPDASAKTLRDGWLFTGDMGMFDARGLLTLKDRSKDVIISGGSNIYPREVEEALLSHAGVSEVCVVGRTNQEWGEVVIAFVVANDGAEVTPAELDAHCLSCMARFKRPKEYFFVDALPKNSYGKVLKRDLRDRVNTP